MTEEERKFDQNNSEGDPDFHKSCPHCGMEMEIGFLRVSGDGITRVFIETQSNQEYLPLSVCFCRECGNVIIFAGR
jgi:hypothetical protein